MDRKFPIIHTNEYIEWDIVEPYSERALINHGQTLERLAERGGLDWYETLCLLLNKPFRDIPLVYSFDYKPYVIKLINQRKETASCFHPTTSPIKKTDFLNSIAN